MCNLISKGITKIHVYTTIPLLFWFPFHIIFVDDFLWKSNWLYSRFRNNISETTFNTFQRNISCFTFTIILMNLRSYFTIFLKFNQIWTIVEIVWITFQEGHIKAMTRESWVKKNNNKLTLFRKIPMYSG